MYVLRLSDGTTGNRFWITLRELEEDASSRAVVPKEGKVIPCHTCEINADLVSLQSLVDLPDLPATGLIEEERRKKIKFIKIAALSGLPFGLMNKERILETGGLSHENSV